MIWLIIIEWKVKKNKFNFVFDPTAIFFLVVVVVVVDDEEGDMIGGRTFSKKTVAFFGVLPCGE